MLKLKKINKKMDKKSWLIVGSLIIFIGISAICGKYLYKYYLERNEDLKIEEFYKVQEEISEKPTNNESTPKKEQAEKSEKNANAENYIAIIKIPKINLEKGLYLKESKLNNVNKNIQILKESNYPDVVKGNLILAGHSGNSRISYFKKLDKLSIDDEASIFYGGIEYKYKVVNIYDIEKTGTVNIVRNANKTTLTLITCRHNTNKQIVVICELVGQN